MSLKSKDTTNTPWLHKQLYHIITVLIVAFLLQPNTCLAQDNTDLIEPNRTFVLNDQEKQLINSLPPLRVMIDDNFLPLSSYNTRNNSFDGLSVDLFRHIASQLNLKYQLLHDAQLSWSDKVGLFKQKKIDLLMPTSFTEERAGYGIFTTSFYDTYYGAIVNKSSNIRIKKTSDLSQHKLGVTKSAAIIPFIQSSVTGAKLKYYSSQAELYQAVRTGEVDVALQNKNVFHDDRFTHGLIDLIMLFTIHENPRKYSYFLTKTEPHHQLSAIINRYLAGSDYSRLISEYERNEDELILKYNEQKHEKKLLEFGIAGSFILMIFLCFTYLNHRRFSRKLATTLMQVQQQQIMLQKSEEKYRNLFDNSRDAMVIMEPPFWNFASANQAAHDMFWIDSKDSISVMETWNCSPEVQPDGRTSIEKGNEMIKTALQDGYHLFEWTHRRFRGEEFTSEVFLTRIEERDGVLLQATIRDITDRKRVEQELQESREKFRCLSEASFEAIFFSENGRCLEQNKMAEKMFGYSTEEFKEMLITELIAPYQQDSVMQIITSDYKLPYEVTGRRKDGSIFPALICGSMMTFKDKMVRVTSISDITEQKKIKDKNRELEQQFHHAQKLESLGVLAGGIAHDFNNILTIILGHCYLANESLDSKEEYKAAFQKIEIAGLRAADLCRQMLTYAGKSPMVQTQINLKYMVDEVSTMLQAAISKNIAIEMNIEQPAADIWGDISQIQQVIMNLIINAAEAIGDKNGTIKVTLSTEELEADKANSDIFGNIIQAGIFSCLEVTDTGCGMDEDTQKRIFEPFYTTKSTGRGLGMSAIRGIIKSHNAVLRLSTAQGTGTTFKVYFPVPETYDFVNSERQAAKNFGNQGGMVLLVEDELTLRDMGTALLETLGFSAITAQNGREALEIYRERSCEIDLILLDLIMPVMGGIEAYHELREISQEVPIVICSGYGIESVFELIENDDNACFTNKPYNPGELRDTMRMMIN